MDTFAALSSYMKAPNRSSQDPGSTSKTDLLTGDPLNARGSNVDACENEHPVYIVPPDQLCSHFFQQKGAIDYESYLRLKREERIAILQFNASIKIQAFWRGWLVRSNWKVITAATIKIQSWIRGWIARKLYRQLVAERDARIRQEQMEKAAIKIQAWWRGILSRKYKLDFQKYKAIQEKNEALKRSIQRINGLESALLKTLGHGDSIDMSGSGSQSGEGSRRDSMDTLEHCTPTTPADPRFSAFLDNEFSPSVESFLIEKLPEYVDELSDSRIAELYAYMANMEVEIKAEKDLEKLVKKHGGVHNLNPEQLERLEESRRVQRERANGILDLAKLVMMGPLKKKLEEDKKREEERALRRGHNDSVDRMFPDMPDRDDLVRPDPVKVEALKDAIRMFSVTGKEKEFGNLQKKHVLLRTTVCPGVYSDIYTTELTQIEKQLKSMKFWKNSLEKERRIEKLQMAKEKRIKTVFSRAIKLCNLRKPTTEDEEEEGEDDDEALKHRLSTYEEYEGEMGPEDECGDDSSDYDYYRCDDGRRNSNVSVYSQEYNPAPPPPTPDVIEPSNADGMEMVSPK